MVELFANSGDADQTLQNAVSDLDLHCLPVTRLGVISLHWGKECIDEQQLVCIDAQGNLGLVVQKYSVQSDSE